MPAASPCPWRLTPGEASVHKRRLLGLATPGVPPGAGRTTRKQLQVGRRRTPLDEDGVQLVRLAAVLAFAGGQVVDLASGRRQGAHVAAADTKQDELGHVAEVEADPTPVAVAVRADLVPDDVGLVLEPPAAQGL